MRSAALGLVAAWSVHMLLRRPVPPRRVVALAARRRDRPSPAHPARAWRPPSRRAPAQRRVPRPSVASALDLAAVVDLLAVGVSAGLSPVEAVRAVGRHGTGASAAAFAEVVRRIDRGRSLVDALAALEEVLGPSAASLSAALSAAVGAGTPLGPVLARLADGERDRARRAGAAAARRLPVVLLGPLVGLVLPAFVVLTLVPVGVATFHRATAAPHTPFPPPLTTPVPSDPARP